MTLNVDLEDVPFAILEAVKARILANRRRLQQGQQNPPPSLRPRPQRPRIGSSSKSWRMPKEAAVILSNSYTVATSLIEVLVNQNTGYDYHVRIYSGDLTTYQDIVFPLAQPPSITLRYTEDPIVGYWLQDRGYYWFNDDVWETSWINAFLQDRLVFALPIDASTFVLYLGVASCNRKRYIGYHVQKVRDASGTVVSANILDSFSESKVNWEVHHRCFLVGKSFIKEIANVPNALKFAAQNLNDLFKQQISYQEPEFAPVAGLPLLNFFYLSGVASSYLQDWSAFQDSGAWRPAVNYSLAKHYGMGDLTTNNHAGSSQYSYFTPSAYTALTKATDIRTATNQASFDSYMAVREAFVNPAAFPGIFLDTGIELIGGNYTRRFRFTETLPTSRTTPIKEALLSENDEPPKLNAPNGLQILVWNWDATAYCREKCLTLGFQSADLQP